MFSTVADLAVPMCIMHSRGTPETMASLAEYGDVVEEVAKELMAQSEKAESAGVHRWMQVRRLP